MKLYEKLVEELAGMISAGVLQPGDRMPSVRKLTRSHSLSTGTVLQAYGILEDKGLIEARPRSGYYVSLLQKPIPPPSRSQPEDWSTQVDVNELAYHVLATTRNRSVVPLGSAFPSPLLFPFKELARSFASVNRHFDPWQTVEDLSPGNPELRQLIARRYLEFGSSVSPEEVVITCGALEALNICLQIATEPGDVVAIESPAFSPALQAIEARGLRAVEIPTNGSQGIDLEILAQVLERHPVKLCWAMTNYQNPTGGLMTDASKKALVELLTRFDVPLIEDDVYAELNLHGERPRPAKAFDTAGLVMHCSSFSKCLAPGFRVGWVAAGRLIQQIERRKMMMTLSASVPSQLAIAAYLRQGGYERHLRQLRRVLATQQYQMLHAISRDFPDTCRVSRPDGGYFLWVEMPPEVDALEVHRLAMDAGISVSPGPMFSPRRGFRNCLRLNYGHPWSEKTDKAMTTLGRIISGEISMKAIAGYS